MMFTRRCALVVVLFPGTSFLVGCSDAKSGPTIQQIEVLRVESEDHIYQGPKGEWDWDAGKKVKMLLKNTGAPVEATVEVTLSCDEGRWEKQSSTKLDSQEQRYVYLDFPEPTVAAGDCLVGKSRVVGVE